MKKLLVLFSLAVISFSLTSQTLESESDIDWTTKIFKSQITLDTVKAGITLPSGKKTASMKIKTKTPELIQRPLLTLFVNNTESLGDKVRSNAITLDNISEIIENGKTTPDVMSPDTKKIKTTNTLNIDSISNILVKHKYGYKPEEPIESVPSRPYSGIIIDARGQYPVHGEYIKSDVYPSFFPQIWDEEMNTVFEKNMVNPKTSENKGIVAFDWSDDNARYKDRVGYDPLYIRAVQVYGRNRTDPVIKRSDALKILTVPENVNLLSEGKIVILLDKENLIYKVASPLKDREYYVKYNAVKQYFFKDMGDNIRVEDDENGILFSVDLKFYPDSDELLPGEKARIQKIASKLKEILTDDSYTVLIEGHTADVGKPVGQLNLSIERTITVKDALVDEGIDDSIFTYKGYGGTKPIAPNNSEEGRAQNRRVDIIARPKATYIQRDW
ncbi:MAG: OmpA family protein [Treponema sp.]|nr:OmpA family protein [Treponema sp.]